MAQRETTLILLGILILPLTTACQSLNLDTAIYEERGVTTRDRLEERQNPGAPLPDPDAKRLVVDLRDRWVPASAGEFTTAWHSPPRSQDLTGACWAFSGTSFLESEAARKTGKEVRLSEMYFIYWECVEKAREYIQTRGSSRFTRGGQGNAVMRLAARYGAVPFEQYGTIDQTLTLYDDREYFRAMTDRLERARADGEWDEGAILADIRGILDKALGKPPESVTVDGETITPVEFFRVHCQLDPEEYVDVMSMRAFPWNEWAVYPVPDNWWSAPYLNVRLDDFLKIFREAASQGYTICLAGDITGPGYVPRRDVAVIPSFDIPGAAIDDAARQLRFDEETSSDDHAVHMVGSLDHNGERWYLIKDSNPPAMDGNVPGYMFYSEDYIALKALNITLHRDALEEVVELGE